MKYLLGTTALLAAFVMGPAFAQSDTPPDQSASQEVLVPTITPPEGYTEADMILTRDELEGAAVYDANNDNIGTVQGVVFASGMTAFDDRTTDAGNASASTSTENMRAENMSAGSSADQSSAGDQPAKPHGDESNVAHDGTQQAQALDDGTAPGMDPDQTGTVAQSADAGAGDAPDGSSATAGSSTNAGTTTDAATNGAGAVTNNAGEALSNAPARDDSATMGDTRVTHAIIDVGGFLGIGMRQVAVPLEDLKVYSNDSHDIRIYLPWTRTQIEALPEFDKNALAP